MARIIDPDPEFLKDLSSKKILNLASILKRLTDTLLSQVQDLYDKHGKSFKVSWFSFLVAIKDNPGCDIKDLAELRNVSSSAASQVVKDLIKEELVFVKTFRETRSKSLNITNKGQDLLLSISPELKHIEKVLLQSLGSDYNLFFNCLDKLEACIKERPLVLRLPNHISIKRFEPCYAESFKTLTQEWFEKDFKYTDFDHLILNHPKHEIIDKGGEIFFAVEDDKAIATVTVLKHTDKIAEIAKLGVTKDYQGWGIAYALIETCLNYARKNNFETVLALTNSKLKAATNLYKKIGFKETKVYENFKIKYQDRADSVYAFSF